MNMLHSHKIFTDQHLHSIFQMTFNSLPRKTVAGPGAAPKKSRKIQTFTSCSSCASESVCTKLSRMIVI